MRTEDLRVQALKNPLGINESPVFSWQLVSDKKDEKNERQTAYRILVSESEASLVNENETGMLWDSGVVKESRCFGILYQGKKLHSAQKAYWKVMVWNGKNQASAWSEAASFETGLLEREDWKGTWIGQGEDYENQEVAPIFAGKFEVTDPEQVVCARAYISGLGVFLADVNGQNLSDAFFEPGESDATKTVYYVTYDITKRLASGTNFLTVTLGNGQYTGYTIDPVMVHPDGTRTKFGRYQKNDSCFVKLGICGRKKLIAQVELTLKDGTRKIVCASDENWLWINGPTIFQNWYGGEDYDACLAEKLAETKKEPSEENSWSRAKKMQPPTGMLMARECPPIQIEERFIAKTVKKLGEGHFLVDVGKNGAGFVELVLHKTTKANRGNWIYLYPAEMTNETGDGVDQRSCTQSWSEKFDCVIRDSYRMTGSGEERWHPSFCYHGFQYVEIVGFPGELTPDQIICCRLAAANEKHGTFETSDETLNRICEITDRSISSNMYWSFTDCPQIEKLGWIETSHLMFASVAAVYDIRAWMKKIIHDICDSQLDKDQAALEGNDEEGFVPGIIPEFYRIGGLYKDPNWNGACVFTPWAYYQYYGDEAVLRQACPVIERYLAYLDYQTTNGVLENYAQMGEWGEYGEHTPNVLVATCAYYRMLVIAKQICEILKGQKENKIDTKDEKDRQKGKCEDKSEAQKVKLYGAKAQAVKEAFYHHPECYDETTGQFGTGSQASYAIALFSGMAKGHEEQAVKALVEAVKKNGYHLTSGEVGLKQVFSSLAEAGYSDVVYQMVMNPTAPSYRVFADTGLTTLPEYWNYEELWLGSMVRSRNHAMMGHVREWMTSFVLGLRPQAPGWTKMLVAPYAAAELTYAKGSVMTPWGIVKVSWKKENESFSLAASIPPGITVTVCMPKEYGSAQVEVGSGEWKFEAKAEK